MNKKENIDFIDDNLEEVLLSFKGVILQEEKYLEKFINIPNELKNKVFK